MFDNDSSYKNLNDWISND